MLRLDLYQQFLWRSVSKILLLVFFISLKCFYCSVSELTGVNILGGKSVCIYDFIEPFIHTWTQQAAYTETKVVSDKEQVPGA